MLGLGAFSLLDYHPHTHTHTDTHTHTTRNTDPHKNKGKRRLFLLTMLWLSDHLTFTQAYSPFLLISCTCMPPIHQCWGWRTSCKEIQTVGSIEHSDYEPLSYSESVSECVRECKCECTCISCIIIYRGANSS